MRVGIRAPHHGALVLEDLHIIDSLLRTALTVNLAPLPDYTLDVRKREACQRQVVSGVEDEHIAAALYRLGGEQRVGRRWRGRAGRRKYGSIVILEDHGVLIRGIKLPTGARIAGAEVALRIVLWEINGLRRLRLTEPWPLCTMWGDEDVLVREGV